MDLPLHRRLVVIAGATAIAVAFCCLAVGSARAEDAAKGEFDNACVMGLASGQTVKTDCSINWTAPDGKVYCFSTEESKTAFLKNPDENIQKAKEFILAKDLAKDNAPTPTTSEQPAAEEGGLVKPTKDFTEDDVNKALADVLAKRSKDGVFVFHDPKLDQDLNLVFEKTRIVRGMKGYGWFDNAIFHDKDEPKKQYAIDFWFKPDGDQLKLMDIRVQKGPKQEGDGWVMITRMPVAWWWLPVEEHPGDTEVTRAWQVMAAIHKYIATHKDANGDLGVNDPKGETVPLEFVEIHQPVRHLKKEGEYFVCTDFRKPGSKDEYYDIDFWVNQKTGKLEVDNVKMHKVPVQEDGVWTQKPLYTFEGMDFDVTN
jgi:YHS domain-containing protein